MKGFEEALLEISWNNLSTENKRYKDIETKAISMITICGIFVTLLLNLESPNCIISKTFFSVTIFSFFVTVIFNISAIKPRNVKMLSTEILIDFYKDKEKESQITGIIATVAAAEKALMDTNESKSQKIGISVETLGISIIFTMFYSLSFLI